MAVQAVSQLFTSWGSQVIRTFRLPSAPGEAPALPAAHQADTPEGCPVCRLHRELAEARSLLEGLAEKTEASGSVPSGLGGTLALVRECYATAHLRLGETRAARSDLGVRCSEVGLAIAEAEAAVPQPGEASPVAVRDAATKAAFAWREAYDLAAAYYSVPEPSRDRVATWFETARREGWDTETAMARLQEVLDG